MPIFVSNFPTNFCEPNMSLNSKNSLYKPPIQAQLKTHTQTYHKSILRKDHKLIWDEPFAHCTRRRRESRVPRFARLATLVDHVSNHNHHLFQLDPYSRFTPPFCGEVRIIEPFYYFHFVIFNFCTFTLS